MSIAVSVLLSFCALTAASATAQTTTRESVGTGGLQGNAGAAGPDMTPDGRYVVFTSNATNLAPQATAPGVFHHDRLTSATTYVAQGSQPTVSDDGRFVAFLSAASTLVPGDTNGIQDAYVWDAQDRTVQRISVVAGMQWGASWAVISGGGRYVVYMTSGGTSGPDRARVFDRVVQTSTDAGSHAFGSAHNARVSADGRYIAFMQQSDLLAGDTNGHSDVYLFDSQTQQTTLVSTSSSGAQGNSDSDLIDMSADGRYLLLTSFASNFFAGDSSNPITGDLFLKDMQTGLLTQVNASASGQRFDVDAPFAVVPQGSLSANGRWITFTSISSIPVQGDTNGLRDVFLYDRDTVQTVRVSVPTGGGEAAGGSSGSGAPSDDGRYVAFSSSAHNLVPGDTNFESDVFVHDRQGTPPCAVALSPERLEIVSSGGGGGAISVTAEAGCTWTASANAAWIHLNTVSGSGNGTISYSYEPYVGGTIIRSGAITVNVRAHGLRQLGTRTQKPFGVWEAPATSVVDNVTGAIPLGGWAVDDVQVTRIRIHRDPVAGEAADLIYLGDGVQVAGARPDVAAANPWAPYNSSAGWGFMLLTNMLPNQGNGSFTLRVFADDYEGQSVQLGTKTLNCTNATATLPFGTIDTPGQGEIESGLVTNFGWVLTPQPNTIPTDGSTIDVYIDGVNVGHPVYNNFRSDIASLFPGYNNSTGAVGYYQFDSRAYADGVHTISWVVTDNQGLSTGIGSRFFTIRNSAAPPALFLPE